MQESLNIIKDYKKHSKLAYYTRYLILSLAVLYYETIGEYV